MAINKIQFLITKITHFYTIYILRYINGRVFLMYTQYIQVISKVYIYTHFISFIYDHVFYNEIARSEACVRRTL